MHLSLSPLDEHPLQLSNPLPGRLDLAPCLPLVSPEPADLRLEPRLLVNHLDHPGAAPLQLDLHLLHPVVERSLHLLGLLLVHVLRQLVLVRQQLRDALHRRLRRGRHSVQVFARRLHGAQDPLHVGLQLRVLVK